ncbi:MAG: NAD-glutamate dehydrogenase, partial [Pseudolabrys sp.]
DQTKLEQDVAAIVRTWNDELAEVLAREYPPAKASALFARYREAFSVGFHAVYSPQSAAADIHAIEALSEERPLGVDFHPRPDTDHRSVGLKVWSFVRPLPLSERVPVLENMGFQVVNERTYRIMPAGTQHRLWLHDMRLECKDGGEIDLARDKARLEAGFLMVMRGQAENDGYNALTLVGRLGWRDVALIRALSRFLRQIRVPFSQDYMWATLTKHAAVATDIVELFHSRFNPSADAEVKRADEQAALAERIEEELQKVESLDEDRILRHFVNAVQAAIRTNYFQTDAAGQPKPIISIKFGSGKLTGVPLPHPLYEIFVYSPRVEGVHLRFGKVARGGIRWSDRPQDFRTEILGLVKAQQVKNAVIVPVGAKGGFVPKLMPKSAPRDVVQAEGVATYKLFISSLLDITDNIATDGVIIPPANVVRHEGDDPYLVVAADKGTATFSDIANEIAVAHDYWLSDAFASGGSAGYDHKAMGITARGAWESVKRHFREMDINIHETPFTAVGVGDMSGDVFGNGVLRENTIKLVAAFDHRDIFIDPDPDPKTSFAERKRLFELPRSSWKDYDKALISKGGGVYSRSSKSVALLPEAQALFGVGASVTPSELMKAVLKAPVDLLFFGGIGTYVRASQEGDADAGDRANDAIRVTGAELRCKVVGEGANLGMTQCGRVEAARKGVRLNTDAIDNSAGVNTSDVEVNMEQSGQLDRAVEYLPDEMALGERRKRAEPLTRPELAVLLAYAKLSLYSELLDCAVPDDPYLGRELTRYFPEEIGERFGQALQAHRLRREIIATQLTNSMINRGGATLIVRIADQTGSAASAIAAAFAAVRNSFGLVELNEEVDALDNRVAGDVQLGLYVAVQDLLLDRIVWFLRHVDLTQGLETIIGHYRDGIGALGASLDTALPKPATAACEVRIGELMNVGVPDALARRIGSLSVLKAAPDIVLVADRAGKSVGEVAATYFATEDFFQLDKVCGAVSDIVVADYFDRLALDRALDSIGDAERRLTAAIVENGVAGTGAVEEWVKPRQAEVERIRTAIHEIAGSGLTLSKLSVAASLLGDLARQ